MKKAIIIILFSFSYHLVSAQEESTALKNALQSLKKNFNAENYDAIFSLYSDDMKTALPLANTVSFFQGLRAQAGNLKQSEFLSFQRTGTAAYKTTFDNGIFTLLITLNEEGEIAGLLLKPFEEPIEESSNAINQLFSKEASITKEQAHLIFDKMQDFPNQTQLAIALIHNGHISYFGAKREEKNIKPVDNTEKVFEIGSISKVFTATLLADFVIENKLKLNDPINDYIDFKLNNETSISFVSLANHTSGLPPMPSNLNLFLANPKNPYSQYNANKLKSYLKDSVEISSEQKNTYQYSNLGAGLLAYVLAEMVDSTYEELLQNRIFNTFEMSNSTTERNKIKEKLIIGLDSEGNETANWDLAALKGAGAILSTVEDLGKFGLAQFSPNNEEIQKTQRSTFKINDNMEIGLGWHLLTNQNYIWHNGGTGGYSSSMILDVASKNGVIILSNVSAFHPKMTHIDALSYELIKSLK